MKSWWYKNVCYCTAKNYCQLIHELEKCKICFDQQDDRQFGKSKSVAPTAQLSEKKKVKATTSTSFILISGNKKFVRTFQLQKTPIEQKRSFVLKNLDFQISSGFQSPSRHSSFTDRKLLCPKQVYEKWSSTVSIVNFFCKDIFSTDMIIEVGKI